MEPFYALAQRCRLSSMPDMVLEVLNTYRSMASPEALRLGAPRCVSCRLIVSKISKIKRLNAILRMPCDLPPDLTLRCHKNLDRTADVWTLLITAHAALGDVKLAGRVLEDAVRDGTSCMRVCLHYHGLSAK